MTNFNKLLTSSQIWQIDTSVDFILAYFPNDRHRLRRQIFEKNLLLEGLLLDRDETQEVHFLKIHVTLEVLCRYSEILKFKFPIRLEEHESEEILEDEDPKPIRAVKSIFDGIYRRIRLDERLFPPQKYEIYHEYSRDKSYLFNITDANFFPCGVRLAVINFILERTAFAENAVDNQNCIGIEKLLSDGVYISSYPIHDGHHKNRGSQRFLLFEEWAKIKNWIRLQPLDSIKNYFGVKIALYFSWLGFYTYMLMFPSFLGLISFLYGIITMHTNTIVNRICEANDTVVLCPKCDECDFTKLSDTCVYSRINHILDNNVTVFFAIVMAIWAAIYLELWKRYSAGIVHRWGLEDFCKQAEHPRPDYLARMKHQRRAKSRVNPVTRQVEPTLDLKAKIPNYILSSTIVTLYVSSMFYFLYSSTFQL
jgi:anoctamin-1